MKPIIDDFSNEVKFQVGQKVKIDFDYVPEEDRDVTTGFIYQIEARFALSPELRRIVYYIRLDGDGTYIKENRSLTGFAVGPKLSIGEENIKPIEP